MSDLDDVGGSSGGSNGDTETEEEAASQELRKVGLDGGGGLDDCAEDDDGAANEHTDPTAPGIDGRTNEGKSDDTTNLVHGRDVGSLDTNVVGVEVGLVGRHNQERAHEGTIISVHGGTEEGDETAEVEDDGRAAPWLRSFLRQSRSEGFGSLEHLLLHNLLVAVRGQLMLSRGEIFFGRHIDGAGP